ncbi:MAG TPA: hypothetical protein VMT42_05020 [candidate division Zixibacteria bacterium]|nr:hypothetical protein [candidate division Zixibacteria bacterium]
MVDVSVILATRNGHALPEIWSEETLAQAHARATLISGSLRPTLPETCSGTRLTEGQETMNRVF